MYKLNLAVFTPLLLVASGAMIPCHAAETRTWQQTEMADFQKGSLKRLSLRSDGMLALAPVLRELFDSSTAYLWAIAQDSKGTLYTGGGVPGSSTAKLFAIDSNGKSSVAAELDGLEIHAIAIDAKDRIYAATAPDGKIYRLTGGKPEIFYDPKAKYIWSIIFDKQGNLYVATGDQGEIHKVTPDGKGTVFFRTEESHVRSLVLDNDGNLVVGTEPSGLVLRITPAGEGFVLYQTAKREITAVAVAKDGSIYAAGVGNRVPAAAIPLPSIVPAVTPAGVPGVALVAITPRPAITAPLSLGANTSSIAGGSEVYRIGTDGYPRKIWSQSQDIVYAIAFDAQGRPLLGTGNKGNIYRLDTPTTYTLLVNVPPTQVTNFYSAHDGKLFAVTGNIGKVFQLGPNSEKDGVFESDIFDSGAFSYWGRMTYEGELNAGTIRLESRTGNLSRAQKNWSPWFEIPLAKTGADVGGRTVSPAARFAQIRATLIASSDSHTPELTALELAYLTKNVAPVIEQIEVTPANYRFPAPPASTLTATPSLTLPAFGQPRRTANPPASGDNGTGATLAYAKGWAGARWLATDDNGDSLTAKVEIRGVNESVWKILKENIRERYTSWDSTAFPDGEYILRVTVSDRTGNAPADALSAELISAHFLVDNTPPQITDLKATPAGSKLAITWKAKDARSTLDKAEYSVNGGDWMLAPSTTRLSDSSQLEYRVEVEKTTAEITVAVRVTDDYDNQAVDKVVVR